MVKPVWEGNADHADALATAARELLRKIDNMTTAQFERGGERAEREALREVLALYMGVELHEV